ncbi:MAG: methionine--tRNA ligase [Candidatus Pacebacteria bacterium]|nr:methionine--tRNA ligase [Candidatus Paceibacterota bacterium]
MSTKNKKFYISTSIPYTNAPPHIGFALEIIQADVLARYHHSLGEDTFFLTGTDEHGLKTKRAAENTNKTPKEFADEISEKFRELKTALNLSNNDFIRTTDKKRHWPAVKKVWLKLKENGEIYKKNYRGFYCADCEAFVTKKDLIDEKCPIHQKKVELIEEENYFFRLSKYSQKIKEIIEKDKIRIIPESRKNEILAIIRQGLEDISFSRVKEKYLGIPVPNDPTQFLYIWPDALTNYISAIGYSENSERFKRYWPADVHCIGKDIVRFHALIWPAILLSLNLELPKTIFVHGFITVDGQKMSKSLGNVIDPFELVKKYGADAIRYFLLREIPPTEDGDFTYEKFEERYNADLAKGVGNLVARVLTMAEKVSSINYQPSKEKEIEKVINNARKKYKKALDEFKFNEALIAIWDLISFSDKYIEKERPWEEKENQKIVIGNLLFTISNIAEMLRPFLPETSEKIFKQLKTKKSKPLFPRI